MEKLEKLGELGKLLSELEGKEKIMDAQTKLLFNLHNFFFPNQQEWGVHCAGCRGRVFKKMKQYYDDQIKEE
jgi:hypothetical protein